MGRRIDVELTSARADGMWTWRAVGARQPKGVVAADLLYEGACVGDVVRAEAEFEIEGILITAVQPPKKNGRSEPDRLEIIGPPRTEAGVTTSLTGGERQRSERGARGGGDRRDRGPGAGPRPDSRGRPPHRDAPPRLPSGGDPARRRAERTGGADRPPGDQRPRQERPERPLAPPPAGGSDRAARPPRPPADATPAQPRPKRLAPGNAHRTAVLATLAPEHQAVAEQVLKGGIPAVRQAVEVQNARRREEGQSGVRADALVALAEELLPRLRAAEWRDRAEAAVKAVDEIALRDLRSVVAGSDQARDDESRLLAGTLRQALDRRVDEHRRRWLSEITGALDEGRLVRALRASARPPDAVTRFPADLAVRLGRAASEAMAADTPPDRWAALLDAVVDSPLRRNVKPAALPAGADETLLQRARTASGRVPALAPLLGISMPPPPGPPRPHRPLRPPAVPPRPVPAPPEPVEPYVAPSERQVGVAPEVVVDEVPEPAAEVH
ncbi:MAG: hypothetical protein ACRD1K_16160 [Acidimicrobiales bacterium]